jgi:general secretion pathway protein H
MSALFANRDECGFTLLELLFVLALLGMTSVFLVVANPRSAERSVSFEAAADELAVRLRETRTRAIVRGEPVHVDFETAAGRYRVIGSSSAHRLPAGTAATLTTARALGPATDVGRITFLPDGSATGGSIRLAANGRSVDITVHWLTGAVSVSRSP